MESSSVEILGEGHFPIRRDRFEDYISGLWNDISGSRLFDSIRGIWEEYRMTQKIHWGSTHPLDILNGSSACSGMNLKSRYE